MMPSATPGGAFEQSDIRFLVEKNADGIIVVDRDGIVLFANPAAEEVFGRPPRSLLGSPIGVPITAGETTEIVIRKPDGPSIEAEVRVVDTVWNQRPAWLASVRDISARKAMEERLRHTAKMEAIGRLTAGIAHDFNNLLTVVLGNLETAQRQAALAEASLTEALDNASRGARRAAGLTARLLAFARRKPLEPRPVDVNALVSGMSDILQRTLGEQIRVTTDLTAGLWMADVDPTELEAAILNLAVNARDAMPHGGNLTIRTAPAGPYDEAQAAALNLQPGAYVVVSVADTGIGMSEDVLRQVFEPFFTTKGGRGTGLGLSQVYGFATQSGGTASLQSARGHGTVAWLYLPRSRSAPGAAPAGATEVAPHPLPRGRDEEVILVVEDDADVRRFATTSLRELGYTVIEAGDAHDALRLIETGNAVRLLLTDLGLPGELDGRRLGEEAGRCLPGLKVLIMTAYAASSLIHDGRLDAGVDLLAKPFTRSALAHRVRDLLDLRTGPSAAPSILLVEDEALVRMYGAQALAGLGCDVREAGSAAEALERLRDAGSSLAAAIVDLGLPDRSGAELIGDIRASHPNLPIVLTTGYGDDAVRRLTSDDPLIIGVPKPYQQHDLQAALQKLGVGSS